MYDFQARIPIDHVRDLVVILRGAERERGEVLMLCGATLGEVGALLKQGFSMPGVTVAESDVDTQVESMVAAFGEPNFDISPYIPLILKIIELLLSRRIGS